MKAELEEVIDGGRRTVIVEAETEEELFWEVFLYRNTRPNPCSVLLFKDGFLESEFGAWFGQRTERLRQKFREYVQEEGLEGWKGL